MDPITVARYLSAPTAFILAGYVSFTNKIPFAHRGLHKR